MRPGVVTNVLQEYDWSPPPYHPSAALFHDPAFCVAVARIWPSLLRWMVAESSRFFRQNVMWLWMYELLWRDYLLQPPRLLLEEVGFRR